MTKLITFAITVLGLAALLCTSRANAQTTINSDGVSVRNSDPQNAFFLFPTGANDNVVEIQMTCSSGAVNADWVFVYELQPNGSITTYPFKTTVSCNIYFSDPNHTNDVFTGSLVSPITVQTADHTVTIDSVAWTAALKPVFRGYIWKATGGQATITVQ